MLKVRVTAPPEKGKANAAVERLLCDTLDLPAAHVRIVAGFSSSRKRVNIDGISETEVRARLSG
jgi:uncharacterized protein YggU (UPF0235/DUF167 family)